MTCAGRPLREDNSPLHAIAQRVGYTSEFAFARAFKREYGVAPGQYRTSWHPEVQGPRNQTPPPVAVELGQNAGRATRFSWPRASATTAAMNACRQVASAPSSG
ncbi:helix-turn-helix domain-containing protein [Streptomyces sp. Rer75]|uniref:helix-turn-helix domain-containing protein n=1 Tax=Streptomyces sp. Rer75 TaxID=2750011 RepID=UPI00359FA34A